MPDRNPYVDTFLSLSSPKQRRHCCQSLAPLTTNTKATSDPNLLQPPLSKLSIGPFQLTNIMECILNLFTENQPPVDTDDYMTAMAKNLMSSVEAYLPSGLMTDVPEPCPKVVVNMKNFMQDTFKIGKQMFMGSVFAMVLFLVGVLLIYDATTSKNKNVVKGSTLSIFSPAAESPQKMDESGEETEVTAADDSKSLSFVDEVNDEIQVYDHPRQSLDADGDVDSEDKQSDVTSDETPTASPCVTPQRVKSTRKEDDNVSVPNTLPSTAKRSGFARMKGKMTPSKLSFRKRD